MVNTNINEPKITSKQRSFSMSDQVFDKLKQLSEVRGIGLSECVRMLINEAWTNHERHLYGYSGVKRAQNTFNRTSKKEQLESSIESLRALDAYDLTTHLLEIGYFPQDEKDEGTGITTAHRIVENEKGEKSYEQQQIIIDAETGEEKVTYRRQVFATFDEIIKDLIKEKKI